MGLFGKSDREKEQDEKARHEEARRKLEEAQRRQQQAAPKPAPAAPRPAAPPAAPGQPGAVPVAQPAPAEETYTVAKGDSLSKIAKHHLGDANAWHRIYEANKQVIGDNPDLIKPGQKLRIPKGPGGGTKLA